MGALIWVSSLEKGLNECSTFYCAATQISNCILFLDPIVEDSLIYI
jgi:hypothetical protein